MAILPILPTTLQPPLLPPPALSLSICRYASFVEALEACSRDNLEFVKDRAVKTMFDLLAGKPEGEGRLLSALVNKLGDPDRKLASKVGVACTASCSLVVLLLALLRLLPAGA